MTNGLRLALALAQLHCAPPASAPLLALPRALCDPELSEGGFGFLRSKEETLRSIRPKELVHARGTLLLEPLAPSGAVLGAAAAGARASASAAPGAGWGNPTLAAAPPPQSFRRPARGVLGWSTAAGGAAGGAAAGKRKASPRVTRRASRAKTARREEGEVPWH